MKATPCPACKSAFYFSSPETGKPMCANCNEIPEERKHRLGMVVGTPGNYRWSTVEKELRELRAIEVEESDEMTVEQMWESGMVVTH